MTEIITNVNTRVRLNGIGGKTTQHSTGHLVRGQKQAMQ